TNNIKNKLKKNKIDLFFENERIHKNNLTLDSSLFCKKYFFKNNINFDFILITIHFHEDINNNLNSNILLAKHVEYFS